MDKYLRILQNQQHDGEEEEDESPPENETPEERKKRNNRKAAERYRKKQQDEMISLVMTTQDEMENLFHLARSMEGNTMENLFHFARLLEANGSSLHCELMKIGDNLKAMIEYHFGQFSKHREETMKIRDNLKAKTEDHLKHFPKHREMAYNFRPPQPSKGNRGQLHYPQQYPQPIPQYNGINNSALLLSSSNHNVPTYPNAENFVEQLSYPQQSPPQQYMFERPNTLAFSGLNVNDNSFSSSELSSYEDGMSYGPVGAPPPPAGTTQYTFNNQVRAEKPQTLSPCPTWGPPSKIPNDGKLRMSYGSRAAPPPPSGTTQYASNNQVRAEKPQTLSPRPTWGQSEIPNDGKPCYDEFFKDNFPLDFQQQMSKHPQL